MTAHILVGVDFSEGVDWAIERAFLLAAEGGWALKLVHAARAAETEQARSRLEAVVAAFADRSVAGVISAGVVVGEPAEELSTLSTHPECLFLVLGPRTSGALTTWLTGSTAEKILQRARKPALVVHRAPDEPYRKVLAATDFSRPSRSALACLLALGLASPPSLALVHAVQFPERMTLVSSGVDPAPMAARLHNEAHEQMEAFIGELGLGESQLPRFIAEGQPYSVIEKVAGEWSPDLLVVGSSGRGPLVSAILGSTALEALRNAPCDVFIAPPNIA